MRDEGESKDPGNTSSAMRLQGVLVRVLCAAPLGLTSLLNLPALPGGANLCRAYGAGSICLCYANEAQTEKPTRARRLRSECEQLKDMDAAEHGMTHCRYPRARVTF